MDNEAKSEMRVWEMELARVAERLRESSCPYSNPAAEAVYSAALNAVATAIEDAIIAVPQEIAEEARTHPGPSLLNAYFDACFPDEHVIPASTAQATQ